jgi:hypothetical protein
MNEVLFLLFCLLCNMLCLFYFTGELKLKAVPHHDHQWNIMVSATDGGGATIQTAVVVSLTGENTRLLFEQRKCAACMPPAWMRVSMLIFLTPSLMAMLMATLTLQLSQVSVV